MATHTVAVPEVRDTVRVGSLEIDRAPVTNERYARFVEATGHRPPLYWPNGAFPATLADHPVVGVDFFDAFAFALWAGGVLPTELEWVEATGLDEQRAYVWGDHFDPSRCNTVRSGLRRTTPVGAYPTGIAPSGCVDMCGNVWEMTCSGYPGDDASIIVKGGSWYDYPVHAQIDSRFRARMNKCLNAVGFRLIYGRRMRLPGDLDAETAALCIAHRAQAHAEPEEEQGAEEFASIVASLRAHAADHIAGLADDAPTGPDAASVAEALSLFDDADRATAEDAPRDVDAESGRWRTAWAALAPRDAWRGLRRRAAVARRTWTEQTGPRWRRAIAVARAFEPLSALRKLGARLGDGVHALCATRDGETPLDASTNWLLARPRAMFAGVCVAIGAVVGLFLALGTDDVDPRHAGERQAIEITTPSKPRRREARPTPKRVAPRKKPATRRPGPPARNNVDQALRDVVSGTPDRRDDGERYLIWHSDESFARVQAALKAPVAPAAKSSLRYVLASIEDKRDYAARPNVVWQRPQRGLLIFLDEINSQTTEEISKVRRTGKAEKLDVTVVYASKDDPQGIAEEYASRLGKVALYVDAERNTFKRLRINQTPAVVGMHGDGRLGFLLFGTTSRSRLAQNVARLKR